MSKATDIWLKLVNELINGIRTIKSYAWDGVMKKMIEKSRVLEMKRYYTYAKIMSLPLGLFRNAGGLLM